jgi:hypothetical protein
VIFAIPAPASNGFALEDFIVAGLLVSMIVVQRIQIRRQPFLESKEHHHGSAKTTQSNSVCSKINIGQPQDEQCHSDETHARQQKSPANESPIPTATVGDDVRSL